VNRRLIDGPTKRQVEVFEAYQRAGGADRHGSQDEAARELGITQGAVSSTLRGYYGAIARVEGSASAQELAEIRTALVRLTELVELFVSRQPIVLDVRGTNRRKADGGRGGRKESRELAREVEEALA
jgi:predicted transcriptional regulator